MSELFPGFFAVPDLHPLFVHFPIVFWVIAPLLWLLGSIRKSEGLLKAARWATVLGAVSGVIALASGFAAADRLGHSAPGHDVVHAHRNWMIAAVSGSVLVSALAFLKVRRTLGWSIAGATAIVAVVAAVGSDRGVLVAHGASSSDESGRAQSEGHAHDHGSHTHGGSTETETNSSPSAPARQTEEQADAHPRDAHDHAETGMHPSRSPTHDHDNPHHHPSAAEDAHEHGPSHRDDRQRRGQTSPVNPNGSRTSSRDVDTSLDHGSYRSGSLPM